MHLVENTNEKHATWNDPRSALTYLAFYLKIGRFHVKLDTQVAYVSESALAGFIEPSAALVRFRGPSLGPLCNRGQRFWLWQQ